MSRPPHGPNEEQIPNQDQVIDGDLVIRDANNVNRIRLDRETGSIFIRDGNDNLVCQLRMPDADLLLFRRTGARNGKPAVFYFDADSGVLSLGGDDTAGRVVCRDPGNNQTVLIDGGNARIIAGNNGRDGIISVQDASSQPTIQLRGDRGRMEAGGNGTNGSLELQGGGGKVLLTSSQNPGIFLRSAAGEGMQIRANGTIVAGTSETGGRIDLFRAWADNPGVQATIVADADSAYIGVGGRDARGVIVLRNQWDLKTAQIDGETGTISLQSQNLTVVYEIAEEGILPGSVVVLDEDARVSPCRIEYDARVAGIVAGAGGWSEPGVALGAFPPQPNSQMPVAFAGRVICRVDANHARVAVGDLLTTSSTPGCAMKARRSDRMDGTLVGKALEPLTGGIDTIWVLAMLS